MSVRGALPFVTVFACLVLALPSASRAGAQVIRGVVVDSASQLRITGVLVLLADSADREVQRRQVDLNGEFGFVAPGPGRYSVRAERWGMTTDTAGGIDVAPGDTVSLRMALVELSVAQLVHEMERIVDLGADRPPLAEGSGRVPEAGAGDANRTTHSGEGGVIAGQVQEVPDAAMEPGGRVGILGSDVSADVDSNGRFVFPGLPEGAYELAYLRPSLEELDWDYPLAEAVVRSGDTTTVSLQPAPPRRVLAQACGLDQWKPYTGVLEGLVLLPGSGLPAPGIRVVAEWHEYRAISVRGLEGSAMTAVSHTNPMGAFRFCGIPMNFTRVEVTAGERAPRVSVTATMSDEKPVVKITLELPPGGGR